MRNSSTQLQSFISMHAFLQTFEEFLSSRDPPPAAGPATFFGSKLQPLFDTLFGAKWTPTGEPKTDPKSQKSAKMSPETPPGRGLEKRPQKVPSRTSPGTSSCGFGTVNTISNSMSAKVVLGRVWLPFGSILEPLGQPFRPKVAQSPVK